MRQWGEFQAVRSKGRSSVGRYLVLGTLHDPSLSESRFGLITSKKTGKAVTRNLLRRRLREIIRKHGDQVPETQLTVTIARWRASQASLLELEADWISCAKKLKIWNPENPHLS